MRKISDRSFYKMSGSGNDFVFFDSRAVDRDELESPDMLRKLCARGTGIGADGVVFLVSHPRANIGLRYYNADGSPAALCGNATLCTAKLAATLGEVDPTGFSIGTDAGVVQARILDDLPEFDLPAIMDAQPTYAPVQRLADEIHLGYVTAGVPHVVIQVPDVSVVDVVGRGRQVRYDSSLPTGANVNFVSRLEGDRWKIRTYERGVEGETLACGTGNVATAVLLRSWGEAGDDIQLIPRSGRVLGVRLRQKQNGGWCASLRGEGLLVFRGELIDL